MMCLLHTVMLGLPTTNLPQEPALQQHHKPSLVHTCGRHPAPCSHQPERNRFWETQRGFPRSKSKTGVRRSCSSGRTTVLSGHCHRSARRQHAALRFCWKPSPSHLAPCAETLGLPSSPGIKAVETCHSIGMEREQPNENLQQQNGSSRELLQKRLC